MGSQLERDEPSIIVWLDGACTPPRSIRRHRAGALPLLRDPWPQDTRTSNHIAARHLYDTLRAASLWRNATLRSGSAKRAGIALRGCTVHNGQPAYIFLTTFTDRTYLA
jgi:hypothetical protein